MLTRVAKRVGRLREAQTEEEALTHLVDSRGSGLRAICPTSLTIA